jgi:RNA polymerase sigma factor (sigma-70 family)
VKETAMKMLDCITAAQDKLIKQISKKPIKFIDNDIFHQKDAELSIMKVIALPVAASDTPFTFGKADNVNNPTSLLTKEQEIHLFLQMNYCKFRTFLLMEVLEKGYSLDVAKKLAYWCKEFLSIRDYLARMNLRITTSIMANYLGGTNLDADEMTSEARLHLVYAIDSFDVRYNTKFSTYVYISIVRSFGRAGQTKSDFHELVPISLDVRDSNGRFIDVEEKKSDEHIKKLDILNDIITKNSLNLNTLELKIIGRYLQDKKVSVREISKELKIKPQVINMIEKTVKAKLREAIEAKI